MNPVLAGFTVNYLFLWFLDGSDADFTRITWRLYNRKIAVEQGAFPVSRGGLPRQILHEIVVAVILKISLRNMRQLASTESSYSQH